MYKGPVYGCRQPGTAPPADAPADGAEAAAAAAADSEPVDPHPGLTQELPSQPDIPAPELVPSHLGDTSAPADMQFSRELGFHTFPESLPTFTQDLQYIAEAPMLVVPTPPPQSQTPALDPHAGGTQPAQPAKGQRGGSGSSSAKSRATRRGPMDEMRQLVRILVKVIPHSNYLISSTDEGGGGNRISEEQIKSYLDSALGEAPRPSWGVPNGWGEYLSGGYLQLSSYHACCLTRAAAEAGVQTALLCVHGRFGDVSQNSHTALENQGA